jgi:hypothetical protein
MKFTKTIFKMLIVPICLAIIFCLPNHAMGKYLTYAEYFFDTDPGQGNGTHITTPCDGNFNEAEEEFCVNNISMPSLSEGRHTFFLRLKDSENKWGMRQLVFYIVSSSPYVSKTITGAEYSIDSGSAVSISAADGAFDEPAEFLLAEGIESSTIDTGSHTLSVRAKDSYNVWSVIRKVVFRVIGSSPYKTLDTAEYFIDTDPGASLGIPLTADDGSFDESAENAHKNNISTSTLALGGHQVNVRFKDNWSYWSTFNGWGPASSKILCVVQKPQVLYPTGQQGPDSVTLKWTKLDSVASYQIHISKLVTFTDTVRLLSSPTESVKVVGLPHDTCLWWRVRGIYSCGKGVWSASGKYCITPTDVQELTEKEIIPAKFQLSNNYPNPFNPETQIEYALPRNCQVNLIVYNVLGQKVRILVDEFQSAGYRTIHWDGKDDHGAEVASGIYFYWLKAVDFSETRKMILLK